MKTLLLLTTLLLMSSSFAQIREKKVIEEQDEYLILRIKTSETGAPTRVEGIVIDHITNEFVPFCKVILTNSKNKIVGCLTDVDGRFLFESLKEGNYTIQFIATGYNEASHAIALKTGVTYNLEAEIFNPPMMTEKPIIYVYPKQKTEVNITLNYQGQLSHTYPKYPEQGWNVTAYPDGTLIDEKGKEYYALFWEGEPYRPLTANDGFIVAGKDVAAFLEDKLAYLGLNRREANEFILYWLPRMENNPFNLIHFSSAAYETLAALKITPNPETLIRVMMVFQPLNDKIDFPEQDLTPLYKTRSGFTVVEWGGCELKEMIE